MKSKGFCHCATGKILILPVLFLMLGCVETKEVETAVEEVPAAPAPVTKERVTGIRKDISRYGAVIESDGEGLVLILNKQYSAPNTAYSYQLLDEIVSYFHIDSSHTVDSTRYYFTDDEYGLWVVRENGVAAMDILVGWYSVKGEWKPVYDARRAWTDLEELSEELRAEILKEIEEWRELEDAELELYREMWHEGRR